MDTETFRRMALSLPHAAETVNWGSNLVLWCGTREQGGKMFAMAELDAPRTHVAGFAAGPELYPEYLERDGFFPAPHLARAHWVAAERWSVMSVGEWREALSAAHAYVFARLPKKTREALRK